MSSDGSELGHNFIFLVSKSTGSRSKAVPKLSFRKTPGQLSVVSSEFEDVSDWMDGLAYWVRLAFESISDQYEPPGPWLPHEETSPTEVGIPISQTTGPAFGRRVAKFYVCLPPFWLPPSSFDFMNFLDEALHHEKHPYTYNGHRKKSFKTTDKAEIVELRARQRTFDGGYMRSALLTFSNALIFVKLFDARFYHIGILFVLLSTLLLIMAAARKKHSDRDFSDQRKVLPVAQAHHARIFGGPFITAGWLVLIVSAFIISAEIALIDLILRINVE